MRATGRMAGMCAAAVFLFLLASLPAAAEAPMARAQGELTLVEPDGAVVISGNGYFLDGQVAVQDSYGQPTTADALKLPAAVLIEYVHTPRGTIIKKLKELPQ